MKTQLPLVNDATAWKGADYANDTSWIYTLSASEVEELAAAARQCLSRGLEVTDIKVDDFPLGSLASTIAGLGRGDQPRARLRAREGTAEGAFQRRRSARDVLGHGPAISALRCRRTRTATCWATSTTRG